MAADIYIDCKSTDKYENTSYYLSDVRDKVVLSCNIKYIDGSPEKAYNYWVEQLNKTVETKGLAYSLSVPEYNQKFISTTELLDLKDSVVTAVIAGIGCAAIASGSSVQIMLTTLLKSADKEFSKISSNDGFFYNDDKKEINLATMCVNMIWKNGSNLTISPVLIKMIAEKKVKKRLFYNKTEITGTVIVKKANFTFTREYCLREIEGEKKENKETKKILCEYKDVPVEKKNWPWFIYIPAISAAVILAGYLLKKVLRL